MTCKSGHLIFKRTCENCKELRNEWYQRANKTDIFTDIEDENENLRDHKSIQDLYQRKHFQTMDVFEASLEYQSWAEEMLNKAKFKCRKDKTIWKYHIKGFSRREIAPKVKLEGSWVSRKVKKISKYLKDQEN